jgi:hypothetical protein
MVAVIKETFAFNLKKNNIDESKETEEKLRAWIEARKNELPSLTGFTAEQIAHDILFNARALTRSAQEVDEENLADKINFPIATGINFDELVDFDTSRQVSEDQEPLIVVYHAIARGPYRAGQELHDFVNYYTLKTLHMPINIEALHYYEQNIREPVTVTRGPDKRVVHLSRESYYARQGFRYCILPLSLESRRYFQVPLDMLTIWQSEVEEMAPDLSPEGPDEIAVKLDPDTGLPTFSVWAGAIPLDMFNIGVVRAILANNGEEGLIHQYRSTRDDMINELQDQNSPIMERDEFSLFWHNFNEYFYYDPINQPCDKFECLLCHSSLQKFANGKKFMIAGLSLDAPEIKQRIKEFEYRRASQYLKILQVLQCMNAMNRTMMKARRRQPMTQEDMAMLEASMSDFEEQEEEGEKKKKERKKK